jgi:transposase
MVWQREALEFSYLVIASNLGVDEATVRRTVDLFRTTGQVAKKPYPSDRAERVLSTPGQLLILNLVVQRPGIYLREIQKELVDFLMLHVSVSTICKFLHKNGFTHQRLRNTALQQDAFLRQQYILDMSVYSPDMLVFVDETGADRRNSLRKYGYSLRGKPATNISLLFRGERVSAISCMSMNGILDVKTVTETTNGDTFYDFVQTHLIPHLLPFNGVNPHSVVVLDNCAIHHCTEVVATLREMEVLVHFLPPYSPDFNPIEEVFSKVKTELKSIDPEILDTETAVLASFTTITPQDCRGWISHSGIYNTV